MEGEHAQDHGRQIGAVDFRGGVAWATEEVLLGVQAVADAVAHAAATTFALICAGLSDGLDRQAQCAGGRAVATDAREASVDHVTNARHRQRGLGNIGREDDAASTLRMENALLVGIGHTAVERQNVATAGAAVFELAA